MSAEDIATRKKELDDRAKELKKQQDHLQVDYQHLYLDCEHPKKYGTNTWGRDPGGAYCPDCGKSW